MPPKAADRPNFQRKKSDYAWLFVILLGHIAAGEYFFPERSTPEDIDYFRVFYNPLGFDDSTTSGFAAKWGAWAVITSLAMFAITLSMDVYMRGFDKEPRGPIWKSQMKAIVVNFVLLPIVQMLLDMFVELTALTKVTRNNLTPYEIVRDCLLWSACFELAWYTQHRAMHDVKPLWKFGHAYHHTWRKPAQMLGITNFAFDHVVEVWVTMSSSFLGVLLFPGNFFVSKAISLGYMILAVLVHWESFTLSRYHVNHHYLVTQNYGSHVPVYDILFGTYRWEPFVHRDAKKAE